MKLIIAVVSRGDSRAVMTELMKEGCQVTKLSSVGGFLTKGNVTLIAGVRLERLDCALEAIKRSCHSRKFSITKMPVEMRDSHSLAGLDEVTVGGATVFILDIDQFHKF